MDRIFISAIVPTIGRKESITRLLMSLSQQTRMPDEVIIADGSGSSELKSLLSGEFQFLTKISIKKIDVFPPNAVKQRQAAVDLSCGEYLLFLDDDVELEPDCIQKMIESIESERDIVGVTADFNNQAWPQPTRIWRFLLRYIYRLREGEWQGRVIGPLLRFGYSPIPSTLVQIEWLGSGNSLVRRSAYQAVGGFSDFFLHRCTMNEDIDLSIKLRQTGKLMFCPFARMAHWHAPEGRVSIDIAAEDDVYNRYQVIRYTQKKTYLAATRAVFLYFTVESLSGFLRGLLSLDFRAFALRFLGRVRALKKIVLGFAS